ncbi:MAG: hypothetical protein IPJ17_05315 [Holophagales bacterium]|nr:MAG: hypothetical protein IPJ17_05315 [Holophagales bacterium]
MTCTRALDLALAVVLGSLAGCASAPPGSPEDALLLTGSTFGTRTLRAGSCYSGENRIFYGAGVVDPASGLEARVVIDPIDGPVVRLLATADERRSLVLRPARCKTFVAEVERTGSWTNGVNEVSLRLTLDCRAPSGDRVRGSLVRASCN